MFSLTGSKEEESWSKYSQCPSPKDQPMFDVGKTDLLMMPHDVQQRKT